MQESQSINCPVCGEAFEITLDPSEGSSNFIIDCEICCRPMTVTVEMEAGEVVSIDVKAA